MLNELIKLVDKTTLKAPYKWTDRIMPYYEPFVRAIWTNDDAYNIIMRKEVKRTSRYMILFKYWAISGVTTLEEAKKLVPICSYCHKEKCMPGTSLPTDIRDWMVECCHNMACASKFRQLKIVKGMRRNYGVDNANSIEGMKELKSELLKRAVSLRGDEISYKRKQTCLDLYGVENVSQLDDVKKAKEDTFYKHFNKNNIFCDTDYMKEVWLKTLGVDNPKHETDTNIKRCINMVWGMIRSRGSIFEIDGKTFGTLSKSEEALTRRLIQEFGVSHIDTNTYVLERVIDGKSRCNVVDVSLDNNIFIEVKGDETYYNLDYLKERIELVKPILSESQRYLVYLRFKNERHMYVVSHDYDKIITQDSDYTRCQKWFGDMPNGGCQYNAPVMDDILIHVMKKFIKNIRHE